MARGWDNGMTRAGVAHFDAVALRACRTESGLTQSELATAISAGLRSIQQWEAGAYVPGLGAVVRLAKVFGCAISDLVVVPEQERGLAELRVLAGLYQAEAADRLGWTKSTLRALEVGERTPGAGQADDLAALYNTTPQIIGAASAVSGRRRAAVIAAKLNPKSG